MLVSDLHKLVGKGAGLALTDAGLVHNPVLRPLAPLGKQLPA